MNQLVLRDKEVGAFINQNYIAVKINGDSLEGKRLRDIYNYPGYPTIILFDKAGNEIDRLIGFDPERKQEFVQTLKDYTFGKGTLQDYLTRLKNEPNNPEYNYLVAKKYFDRGDFRKAREYALKFVQLDKSKYFEGQYLVAYCDVRLSNSVTPLLNFAESCKDSAWARQAYLDIARFYRRQNNPEKAIETYELALKQFPKDSRLMNTFAWYIFQSKLESYYTHGIEVARKAVEISPEDDGIWDTLGQLLFAAGNVNEAIEAMQKAHELNPKESSYKENLKKYRQALKTGK